MKIHLEPSKFNTMAELKVKQTTSIETNI